MESHKEIFYVIGALLQLVCIMFLGGRLQSSRAELESVRSQLESTTEQLHEAAEYNTELRAELEAERRAITESRDQLRELSDITNTGAGTIQECIQLVRAIREKVQNMEDCFANTNTNLSH